MVCTCDQTGLGQQISSAKSLPLVLHAKNINNEMNWNVFQSATSTITACYCYYNSPVTQVSMGAISRPLLVAHFWAADLKSGFPSDASRQR